MADDLKLVVVPKELYYHEVAYVRGLETQIEAMQEYAKQARLRENAAEDARVHLSFELEKARAQIAAIKETNQGQYDEGYKHGFAATGPVAYDTIYTLREALTGLVSVAENFLPLCEVRSPLHYAVAAAHAALRDVKSTQPIDPAGLWPLPPPSDEQGD